MVITYMSDNLSPEQQPSELLPVVPPPPAAAQVPAVAPQYAAPVPQGVPVGYQVAPKNPALALLASFFIPGLGTMMNGQAGKGVGILAGYIVSWILTFVIIGIFGLIGFWVWGMVDAYQGAKKWNAAHGIIS